MTTIYLSEALDRLDNDTALYRAIATAYLKDIPLQIVRLREAVSNGDFSSAERTFHSIKSASYSVGAHELGDKASLLERHFAGEPQELSLMESLFLDYHEVEEEIKVLLRNGAI